METRQANSGAFMLSQQALKEFKEIWKLEHGEDIPEDFAIPMAVALLTLFDKIYRPVKKEWLDEKPEHGV